MKPKRALEKWFCPLCNRGIAAKTKLCERCRCEKCGRPLPRDPHACER
ncbi:MAG TPA: hypothetical protein VJ276_24465 [Thermoanaerobaculia bacterium]|nr:hypothetical protein [Thermoanaerobaculia bacterium]